MNLHSIFKSFNTFFSSKNSKQWSLFSTNPTNAAILQMYYNQHFTTIHAYRWRHTLEQIPRQNITLKTNKQTNKPWTHAQHHDQSLGQPSISHSSLLLWKVSLLGSDSPHLNSMSETFSSGFLKITLLKVRVSGISSEHHWHGPLKVSISHNREAKNSSLMITPPSPKASPRVQCLVLPCSFSISFLPVKRSTNMSFILQGYS